MEGDSHQRACSRGVLPALTAAGTRSAHPPALLFCLPPCLQGTTTARPPYMRLQTRDSWLRCRPCWRSRPGRHRRPIALAEHQRSWPPGPGTPLWRQPWRRQLQGAAEEWPPALARRRNVSGPTAGPARKTALLALLPHQRTPEMRCRLEKLKQQQLPAPAAGTSVPAPMAPASGVVQQRPAACPYMPLPQQQAACTYPPIAPPPPQISPVPAGTCGVAATPGKPIVVQSFAVLGRCCCACCWGANLP